MKRLEPECVFISFKPGLLSEGLLVTYAYSFILKFESRSKLKKYESGRLEGAKLWGKGLKVSEVFIPSQFSTL
jgi:hypothetical protein